MPLRICFITAELAPLAKAGGLADVAAALLIHPVEFMQHMLVKIGAQDFPYSVLSTRLPDSRT